jgi:predicted DNA-binding protein (MmcQ/YjbR family)
MGSAAIPDDEIFEAIDVSYAMVVSKLPKRDRPAG